MKTFKPLLVAALFFVLITSCNDKNSVKVDPEGLTQCEGGSKNCQYIYTEHSDIDSISFYKNGNYRLFYFSQQLLELGCNSFSNLYIKAPMQGTSFSLSNEDIAGGKVGYLISCPCCDVVPLEPVAGYVKGTNVDPGKPADQARWLIDARIILGFQGKVLDTLVVKQYFTPNFVYN
jgi:hypothetical protein